MAVEKKGTFVPDEGLIWWNLYIFIFNKDDKEGISVCLSFFFVLHNNDEKIPARWKLMMHDWFNAEQLQHSSELTQSKWVNGLSD